MKATITINGSDHNAWARYGLTCNPFPQHARKELAHMDRVLQLLDSDPIQTVDLERLLHEQGASDEFIRLCRDQYQAGVRVRFDVTWPDDDEASTPPADELDVLKAAIFEEIAAAGAPSFKWDGAVDAMARVLLGCDATTEEAAAIIAYDGFKAAYGVGMASRKHAGSAARAFLRLKAGVLTA